MYETLYYPVSSVLFGGDRCQACAPIYGTLEPTSISRPWGTLEQYRSSSVVKDQIGVHRSDKLDSTFLWVSKALVLSQGRQITELMTQN